MPESDDETPVDRLRRAIQEYLNEIEDDGPVLLDDCVLIWESVWFDEDGDAQRGVEFCVPTEGTNISATMGMLVLAQDRLRERLE